jgi:hypothetical protein
LSWVICRYLQRRVFELGVAKEESSPLLGRFVCISLF